MKYDRIYNFSAGPATMPVEVLEEVARKCSTTRAAACALWKCRIAPKCIRPSSTKRKPIFAN
jgi:hypothetical protein